jgi:hypothetical protein
MKVSLRTAIGVAILAGAGSQALAGTDPPTIYWLVNTETGESIPSDRPLDNPLRDGGAETNYDSLSSTDPDGENFAGEFAPQTNLRDDYEMWALAEGDQLLVTHTFYAGFGNGGSPNGLLFVRFYNQSEQQTSQYALNLTGFEGFFRHEVSFSNDIPLATAGFVEFEFAVMDPPFTAFGLMEDEPQIGENDEEFLRDGFNIVDPPSAYGGIAMELVTAPVPSPGSVAPMIAACLGLAGRRRQR